MILRSITQHVKDQNWFAVVLDFVIVVVGVFIGLQVANWNDVRIQKSQERVFLSQLRSEISDNIKVTNYQQRYTENLIAGGRRALTYLNAEADCLDNCERLLIDFFHASQVWGMSLDDAKYREAQSLGFPSNQVIDEKVQEYYAVNSAFSIINTSPPSYRESIRGHITPDVAAALWAQCWKADKRVEHLLFGCVDNLKILGVSEILHNIRADQALTTELQFWIGQNILGLQNYPFGSAVAELAIAAISDELEKDE